MEDLKAWVTWLRAPSPTQLVWGIPSPGEWLFGGAWAGVGQMQLWLGPYSAAPQLGPQQAPAMQGPWAI